MTTRVLTTSKCGRYDLIEDSQGVHLRDLHKRTSISFKAKDLFCTVLEIMIEYIKDSKVMRPFDTEKTR